jgi:bifunctional non-homologous end joining protein LigD
MRTISPMMPKAVDALPTGPAWSYELKIDGYRALAVKDDRGVRLLSRSQTNLTRQFKRIAADIARLPAQQCVLDGELVALDEHGHPSFQGLQSWYRNLREGRRLALAYYAFDLLELDGQSWMMRPLSERRRRLSTLLDDAHATVLQSVPLPGRLREIERQIQRLGLEGIVAKRRSSRYQPGERSRDWLKLRFTNRQEFVVGGYRPNGASFDALLVGHYQDGRLHYAGSVRAGFTKHSRDAVMKQMSVSSFKPTACPFVDLPHHLPYRTRHPWDARITSADMTTLRWLPPALVVEVAFLEWGRHGLLRDGRFLGIREDKDAHAVTREVV